MTVCAFRRVAVAGTLGSVLLVAAWSCAPRGRAIEPGPGSFWLHATGFDDRSHWPSTVLHLGQEEMGGATRISFLLDESPRVALLPARGEGWGVYLLGEEGELMCELEVRLNGARSLRPPMSGHRSVDGVIAARDLSGLEIHVGAEGPVRDPEGCGSLLLWSETASEPWEPPFRGRVVGVVRGNAAGEVTAVRLEPDGQRIRPDDSGRYELSGVVPGRYEVVFMGADGPLLRREARVWAFFDTRMEVEVTRQGPGGPVPSVPSGGPPGGSREPVS